MLALCMLITPLKDPYAQFQPYTASRIFYFMRVRKRKSARARIDIDRSSEEVVLQECSAVCRPTAVAVGDAEYIRLVPITPIT